MTREHDTRIWRIVEHHVHAARDQLDCSEVRKVGVDETSARKGQDYGNTFADMELGRAVDGHDWKRLVGRVTEAGRAAAGRQAATRPHPRR